MFGFVCQKNPKKNNSTVNSLEFSNQQSIMFFCAISGEPPQDPVVSSKSGHVYERRLIMKYLTENGTDPITGDKLEESDLISIKASELFFFR